MSDVRGERKGTGDKELELAVLEFGTRKGSAPVAALTVDDRRSTLALNLLQELVVDMAEPQPRQLLIIRDQENMYLVLKKKRRKKIIKEKKKQRKQARKQNVKEWIR